MTQFSPLNFTQQTTSQLKSCFEKLTTNLANAPIPIFTAFGCKSISKQFDYKNARDLFLCQEHSSELSNSLHENICQTSLQLFFGARCIVESKNQFEFFKKIETIKNQNFLIVCPYASLDESASCESFLALEWLQKITLTSEHECTISVDEPYLQNEFANWIQASLATDLKLPSKEGDTSKKSVSVSQTQTSFEHIVRKTQEKMSWGEAYLVNLTLQAQNMTPKSNFCFEAFAKNLNISDLRYFVLFRWNNIAIESYSPERFIGINDRWIVTEPIKGTAPTCKTNPDNCSVLWDDPKEMNEQCMVVDLLRNDFNTICQPGSVQVVSPFSISVLGGLLQMQSTIIGKLTTDSIGVVLKKMLPAGSISGTPKRQACKIIHDFESKPRGYYTGVIGVQNKNKFDSCILIRSYFRGNLGDYVGAGAGITTLSNPTSEYNEILNKLKSFGVSL